MLSPLLAAVVGAGTGVWVFAVGSSKLDESGFCPPSAAVGVWWPGVVLSPLLAAVVGAGTGVWVFAVGVGGW